MKFTRLNGLTSEAFYQFFLRFTVASTVAQRMKYLGESVARASSAVVSDLKTYGGTGGVIAVDDRGNSKWISDSTAGESDGLFSCYALKYRWYV